MKQHIDMKLSLKIYLTNVLNILKEQLCCGLRILMMSHDVKAAIGIYLFSIRLWDRVMLSQVNCLGEVAAAAKASLVLPKLPLVLS